MKLHHLLGKLATISMVIAVIFLASCTDKAKEIGAEVDNQADIFEVGFTDTSSVVAYSFLLDSVRTDSVGTHLCGSMFDPELGEITASMATQILLVSDTPDFGPNPVVDSLVLFLLYNGHYGDTTVTQTFNVYELDELLDFTDDQYTNRTVMHKPTLLGTKTFLPQPGTEVVIPLDEDTNDTLPAYISINLTDFSHELADKIINGPEESMNTQDFVEYVYGLYIEPEKRTDGGAIPYFNLLSSYSRLKLYYHNDSLDDQRFNMIISASSEKFTMADHNNYDDASQEFKDQVLNDQKELGRNNVYLQGLAGVETKITFPHIQNLRSLGQIVINRAELVLASDAVKMDGYEHATQLALLKYKEDGTFDLLPDQFEGEDFFGGKFNEADQEYRFRITKYIQNLITDENAVDYGLNLAISGFGTSAERMILYGTNPDNTALFGDRLRLEITYSIVNE